jgi:hypothetical protein
MIRGCRRHIIQLFARDCLCDHCSSLTLGFLIVEQKEPFLSKCQTAANGGQNTPRPDDIIMIIVHRKG